MDQNTGYSNNIRGCFIKITTDHFRMHGKLISINCNNRCVLYTHTRTKTSCKCIYIYIYEKMFFIYFIVESRMNRTNELKRLIYAIYSIHDSIAVFVYVVEFVNFLVLMIQ